MGDNVVIFPGVEPDVSPEDVLHKAMGRSLKDAIVICHGDEFDFRMYLSSMTLERALWLIEVAKRFLLDEAVSGK